MKLGQDMRPITTTISGAVQASGAASEGEAGLM